MSPSHVRLERRPARHLGGLALLLVGAVPAVAAADPPIAEDFTIQYWTTNEDGERSRQMTSNDLRGYVNKARCECGQAVSARVRLSASQARDSVQVRTFVGSNCAAGQSGNNIQARPCVLAVDDFTNTYTRNVDFEFNPLWLATGVTRDSARNIDDAEAAAGCDTQQGDGGLWVCVENSEQTDCQSAEFVIQGTQTEITDSEGNAPSLTYDFNPPNINATNFRAVGGDGSVVIKWDNSTTTDVQGFRALCANLDGSPVPGKGFSLNSVTAENRGSIYYTADNLCPDGPFDQVEVTDEPDDVLPDETTGGTEGDTDDGAESGSTGFAGFGAEPGVQHGGSTCCIPGGPCDDTPCFASVVTVQGSCEQDWDESCAGLAADYCQVCGGAGNCCAENETAECSDQTCAEDVCLTEGFLSCCVDRWTNDCANEAKSICDTCQADTTGGDMTGTTSSGSTTVGGTGTDTSGSGTDTDGTDTDGLDTSGIESLDWAYVCSDFVAANASSVRVNGLTNDQDFQVMLVAFDYAGNPVAASEVFTATPRETTDLWEQCNAQGELCGTGGFCSCTSDPTPQDTGWWLFAGLFGLLARRRRTAAKAGPGGHA